MTPQAAWESAERIKTAWRDEGAADAVAALRECPHLAGHKSVVIDLAYEEYLRCERAGSPPDPEEFARRFPDYQDSVQDLIEAHRLLTAEPQRLPLPEEDWLEAGGTFEGLELRRELGRGAFGRAYLGFDPAIGLLRAVKVTPGGGAEAKLIGRLNHDHVVGVLWARPAGCRMAVCMPYVGATTLADVIERAKGETPSARLILESATPADDEPPDTRAKPTVLNTDTDLVAAAAIGAKLAAAVAYLHDQGVAHGDVKPTNAILQRGGSPMMIDFNLAAGEEPPHAIRGTPAYMAPELLDGAIANRKPATDGMKADVFALGVTLVELLGGRHPYRARSNGGLASLAIAVRKCTVDIPGLPAAVIGPLKRALAIDPAARPQAAELAGALDRFVHRTRTQTVRRTRIALGSLAGILLAGLVLGSFLKLGKPPVERAPETAAEFHARGLAALHDGKPDSARADFVTAHERGADPRDLALAAYCYSLGGDQKLALEMNTLAVDAGVTDAEVRNNRGSALLKLGKAAEALKELDAALAASKNLRAAKYNRAMARYLLALPDANKDRNLLPLALADIDDVLKDGPYSSELHMDAARIYALASANDPGLRDRAFEQMKHALKLGQSPAKLVADKIFQKHLAADPRLAELSKAKQQPVVPSAQLQFVEPFQK